MMVDVMSNLQPKFKVGDKVTYTNEFGVRFPGRTVKGVVFNFLPHIPISYDVVPTDCPWFPKNEGHLSLEF